MALPRFFQEMPPVNVDAWLASQRLKVSCLSLNICLVVVSGSNAGREVVNFVQLLIVLEQCLRQNNQVKPIEFSPAFAFHSKVKVKSVHISYDALHKENTSWFLRVNRVIYLAHFFGFPYKICLVNPPGDRISGLTPPLWRRFFLSSPRNSLVSVFHKKNSKEF